LAAAAMAYNAGGASGNAAAAEKQATAAAGGIAKAKWRPGEKA